MTGASYRCTFTETEVVSFAGPWNCAKISLLLLTNWQDHISVQRNGVKFFRAMRTFGEVAV